MVWSRRPNTVLYPSSSVQPNERERCCSVERWWSKVLAALSLYSIDTSAANKQQARLSGCGPARPNHCATRMTGWPLQVACFTLVHCLSLCSRNISSNSIERKKKGPPDSVRSCRQRTIPADGDLERVLAFFFSLLVFVGVRAGMQLRYDGIACSTAVSE